METSDVNNQTSQTFEKIDKIAKTLKHRVSVFEKKKKILSEYIQTLKKGLDEWDSSAAALKSYSDESIKNLNALSRKLSITKLLFQRLSSDSVSITNDIELFEKFTDEKSFFLIVEWASSLKIVDPDMAEIIDPEIYGLSANVPRSFSDLLKWVPDDNSNKLDLLLFDYLKNLKL